MIKLNIINHLANRFHKNKVLRFFFLGIYRKYKTRVSFYKQKAFHKNGRTVLARFCKALDEMSCKHWLEFGSLIGAVREHDFIAHDYDIDLGMFLKDRPQNLEKEMKKYGFTRSRYIKVDDGSEAFEETYVSQGVSIDVFYFHLSEAGDTMYCYEFLTDPEMPSREFMDKVGGFWTMRDTFPYQGFTDYNFLDIPVRIPLNYDEHLKVYYGNYMQSDPEWNVQKAHSTVLMKDTIGRIFEK